MSQTRKRVSSLTRSPRRVGRHQDDSMLGVGGRSKQAHQLFGVEDFRAALKVALAAGT